MITKTLKELRALARSRDLKGYAKLSRDNLARLLAKNDHQMPTAGNRRNKTPPSKTAAPLKSKSDRSPVKSRRAAGKKMFAASTTGTHIAAKPELRRLSDDEEQVESTKYATVPHGVMSPPAVATDLGEDIDRLPAMAEPVLCLLPVKPGVLHGYWQIPPDTVPHLASLKLRLGRIVGNAFDIIEEISPPEARGHWYFHLNESEDIGVVFLQLGYYDPDGGFITATRRGIARIPNLYASEHIDRLWWVSEERFHAMYQRAGGFVRGARLGWGASIGNPDIVLGVSSSQHARPGKNNSR